MSTITSIANEMAKRFIVAKDKKYALNKIIYDINYLVFADNKEPLDYKAKSAILTYIFNLTAGRETLQLNEGESLSPDFSDIVILFERRNFILKHLKTGIKQQSMLN